MIKKIGIQNYRIFNEMTEFDLRPITVLTGPNNSGKSSFTKLLLLLKNDILNLDFHHGNHHLESFEKILNWESKDDTMVIRLEMEFRLLDFNYVDLFYQEGRLVKVIRHNKEETLFEMIIEKDKDITAQEQEKIIDYFRKGHRKTLFPIKMDLFYLDLNLGALIRTILDFEFQVKSASKYPDDYNFEEPHDENMPILENLRRYQNTEFEKDVNKLKTKEEFETSHIGKLYEQNKAFFHKLQDLRGNYSLYDVQVNGERILSSDSRFQTFLGIQFSHSLQSSFGSFNSDPILHKDFVSGIEQSLGENMPDFDNDLENAFGSDIEITENFLFNIIFGQQGKWAGYFLVNDDGFFGFKRDLFKNIFQVSANRVSSKRVLSNSDETDMAEVMRKFILEDEFKIQSKLISDVLDIIGIKGELQVERIGNSIFIPYLKMEDGKQVNLADLGLGYAQMITMVLKIIQNKEREAVFIVEEPEANLHPNFQSKLADILVLLLSRGYKFIIETHSEYLIRKLQYLIAKQEAKPEDCVIYYFNADEHVSEKEPKVKQIEINEDGNLTEHFGPGFFDEAIRIQFELLKLNQERFN